MHAEGYFSKYVNKGFHLTYVLECDVAVMLYVVFCYIHLWYFSRQIYRIYSNMR